ncbi:hypothetical protein KKC91_11075 [bacterium]|nr:hypothetical protein [bacterium]
MNRIDFTVRQKGEYNRYCYYKGFDGEKHMWTKKLKEADLFLDANTAFDFKDKLKFNSPRVVAIITNGESKIIKVFKPTRKKYYVKQSQKD